MTLKLRYDGGERPWKIVNASTGRVVDALDDRHRAETSMISRMISDPVPFRAQKESSRLSFSASSSGRALRSK